MKIEVSPEMRRFNLAVERADALLHGHGDWLNVPQLIHALMSRNFWNAECGRVALELEAAHKAISGNHAGENQNRK